MEILFILSIIALLILLLSRIPVGIFAENIGEGLIVKAKVACLHFQVHPSVSVDIEGKPEEQTKKEQAQKTKKIKKEKKQKAKKKPETSKASTPSPKITINDVLLLLPVLQGGLNLLCKSTQINRLDLELVVGHPDPVEAVMLYGKAHAILGALWLPLDQTFYIKDGRARVRQVFDEQAFSLYGVLIVTLTVGQIVTLALYFLIKGYPIFKEMKGSEQHGKQTPNE